MGTHGAGCRSTEGTQREAGNGDTWRHLSRGPPSTPRMGPTSCMEHPETPRPCSTQAGPLVTPKESIETMLLECPVGKQLPQTDPKTSLWWFWDESKWIWGQSSNLEPKGRFLSLNPPPPLPAPSVRTAWAGRRSAHSSPAFLRECRSPSTQKPPGADPAASQGLWNPVGAPAPLLRAPHLLGAAHPLQGCKTLGIPN